MTTVSPTTTISIQVQLTAAEREALKKIKGERTFTELFFDIKEGALEPVRLPDTSYEHSNWVVVRINLTKEQIDVLFADAARRGTSVSKAARADMVTLPEKRKRVASQFWISPHIKEALATVRATPDFSYTGSWSERKAFVEIATVLLRCRAGLENLNGHMPEQSDAISTNSVEENHEASNDGPVTGNVMRVAMTRAAYDALKEIKGDRTFTELLFDIKDGVLEPVRLSPSAHDGRKTMQVKIYPTDAQVKALVADAKQRGTTVSKGAAACIFGYPVKANGSSAVYQTTVTVPESALEAMMILRAKKPFTYTQSMPEAKAFALMAAALIQHEALTNS